MHQHEHPQQQHASMSPSLPPPLPPPPLPPPPPTASSASFAPLPGSGNDGAPPSAADPLFLPTYSHPHLQQHDFAAVSLADYASPNFLATAGAPGFVGSPVVYQYHNYDAQSRQQQQQQQQTEQYPQQQHSAMDVDPTLSTQLAFAAGPASSLLTPSLAALSMNAAHNQQARAASANAAALFGVPGVLAPGITYHRMFGSPSATDAANAAESWMATAAAAAASHASPVFGPGTGLGTAAWNIPHDYSADGSLILQQQQQQQQHGLNFQLPDAALLHEGADRQSPASQLSSLSSPLPLPQQITDKASADGSGFANITLPSPMEELLRHNQFMTMTQSRGVEIGTGGSIYDFSPSSGQQQQQQVYPMAMSSSTDTMSQAAALISAAAANQAKQQHRQPIYPTPNSTNPATPDVHGIGTGSFHLAANNSQAEQQQSDESPFVLDRIAIPPAVIRDCTGTGNSSTGGTAGTDEDAPYDILADLDDDDVGQALPPPPAQSSQQQQQQAPESAATNLFEPDPLLQGPNLHAEMSFEHLFEQHEALALASSTNTTDSGSGNGHSATSSSPASPLAVAGSAQPAVSAYLAPAATTTAPITLELLGSATLLTGAGIGPGASGTFGGLALPTPGADAPHRFTDAASGSMTLAPLSSSHSHLAPLNTIPPSAYAAVPPGPYSPPITPNHSVAAAADMAALVEQMAMPVTMQWAAPSGGDDGADAAVTGPARKRQRTLSTPGNFATTSSSSTAGGYMAAAAAGLAGGITNSWGAIQSAMMFPAIQEQFVPQQQDSNAAPAEPMDVVGGNTDALAAAAPPAAEQQQQEGARAASDDEARIDSTSSTPTGMGGDFPTAAHELNRPPSLEDHHQQQQQQQVLSQQQQHQHALAARRASMPAASNQYTDYMASLASAVALAAAPSPAAAALIGGGTTSMLVHSPVFATDPRRHLASPIPAAGPTGFGSIGASALVIPGAADAGPSTASIFASGAPDQQQHFLTQPIEPTGSGAASRATAAGATRQRCLSMPSAAHHLAHAAATAAAAVRRGNNVTVASPRTTVSIPSTYPAPAAAAGAADAERMDVDVAASATAATAPPAPARSGPVTRQRQLRSTTRNAKSSSSTAAAAAGGASDTKKDPPLVFASGLAISSKNKSARAAAAAAAAAAGSSGATPAQGRRRSQTGPTTEVGAVSEAAATDAEAAAAAAAAAGLRRGSLAVDSMSPAATAKRRRAQSMTAAVSAVALGVDASGLTATAAADLAAPAAADGTGTDTSNAPTRPPGECPACALPEGTLMRSSPLYCAACVQKRQRAMDAAAAAYRERYRGKYAECASCKESKLVVTEFHRLGMEARKICKVCDYRAQKERGRKRKQSNGGGSGGEAGATDADASGSSTAAAAAAAAAASGSTSATSKRKRKPSTATGAGAAAAAAAAASSASGAPSSAPVTSATTADATMPAPPTSAALSLPRVGVFGHRVESPLEAAALPQPAYMPNDRPVLTGAAQAAARPAPSAGPSLPQ
ncbi:hypothetical protein H9P43_001996 [Blastocladiella emersonii ATCC 22665]|nr:hypothetical protein H9P43_001996 [Blastocladiella emersonii ATCC 22665]